MAAAVRSAGAPGIALVVAVELGIGLIALSRSRFRTAAVWAGIGLTGLYWAVGQSFGELFNGQATDPEAGPLVILLGLTVIGAMGLEPSPLQIRNSPMCAQSERTRADAMVASS
jgi:hypothetical protein